LFLFKKCLEKLILSAETKQKSTSQHFTVIADFALIFLSSPARSYDIKLVCCNLPFCEIS